MRTVAPRTDTPAAFRKQSLRTTRRPRARGLAAAAGVVGALASWGAGMACAATPQLIPNAELRVVPRYVGGCCYEFDVWQYAGGPGNVTQMQAVIAGGATAVSAFNGWAGPAPVISGGGTIVDWTFPAPGLDVRFPTDGPPEYTVKMCFNNLTPGTMIFFTGFDAMGNTAPSLRVPIILDGPNCSVPVDPCRIDCSPNERITICYEGGRDDAYGAPNDPASPRPPFAAWLTSWGPTKHFDDPTVNRQFGHTFRNLPTGIVSARLEIKLRAECELSYNDTLGAQFTGSGTAWNASIASLAGGTWNCGQEATIVLDLGALPGGANLIPLICSNRFVDFRTQDDTTVDWARLTIEVCPCDNGRWRTYIAGIPDNFAPPIDPPNFRQPALDALRSPPFGWHNSDHCILDRGWGNTFFNLPPGIIRAFGSTRMRACGGGSNNDSINFDMRGPGAPTSFYRGFQISDLPGNGGAWNTSMGARNFSWNFGTVVANSGFCRNILGGMADRMFDVYVQDDTDLDFFALRVYSCQRRLVLHGVPFVLKGISSAVFTDTGVRIEDIGAGEGGDGVAFDVSGSKGLDLSLGGDAARPPAGTRASWALLADTDQDGESEVIHEAMLTWTQNGSLIVQRGRTLDPDACTEIELHNSSTGDSLTVCRPGLQLEVEGNPLLTGASCRAAVPCFIKIGDIKGETDGVHRFNLGDGVSGEFDSFTLRSPGHDHPVESFSMSWKTPEGEDPLSLDIASEGLRTCYVSHLPVGDVSLDANHYVMVASNIPASGGGMRAVMHEPAEEYGAQLAFGSGGEMPVAPHELLMEFVGSQGGVPDQHLGMCMLRASPGVDSFFDISADFSPTGTDRYRFIVTDGDETTGEFDSPSGHLTSEGGKPRGCGKGAVLIGGVRTSCIWIDWDNLTTFNLPGGQSARGTRLAILAATATETFDYLQEFRYAVMGVDELVIGDQFVTPYTGDVRCPADFNNDGGVDGADVEAFFEAWENGLPEADVNQDGGIDGLDVQTFFLAWENGGCD
jgi:hypothetical protein